MRVESASNGTAGARAQQRGWVGRCPRATAGRRGRVREPERRLEEPVARWTGAIAALPFRQGRVLDLGCAVGYSTRLLRRRGYAAVGVDASSRYIARVRRADPGGTYLVCDAVHVPLADRNFDGILCLDV